METYQVEVEVKGVVHIIEGTMSGDITHDPQEDTFRYEVCDIFTEDDQPAQITKSQAEDIVEDAIHNPFSEYSVSIDQMVY